MNLTLLIPIKRLKRLQPFVLLAALSFLANSSIQAQCSSDSSLSTPYNSNNGQRGVMFNIVAKDSVSVKCFSASLYAGTTANYEIYFKEKTYEGSENNAAAWTLLGSASAVTSAGNNLQTHLPINFNVLIPAGDTAGFYITNDFGGGTSYTDGTMYTNLAEDASIKILGGIGKSYPFGLTFTTRYPNVTPRYDAGAAVLPVQLLTFNAHKIAQGIQLSWKTASELENDFFTVEKSQDGINWKTVEIVEGSGNTNAIMQYQALDLNPYDGTSFYRLKQTDMNGEFNISDIVSVSYKMNQENLAIYPNPFTSSAQLNLIDVDITQIKVYNHNGEEVTNAVKLVMKDANSFILNGEHLTNGAYMIKYGTKHIRLIKAE